MIAGQVLRRRAKHVIVPLLGALLIAYFGYHAVHGERGLFAWLRLTREIRNAELSLELFQAERHLVERRAKLLRPDGIDRDMLDERARFMLNLGQKDEVVIMLHRQEALPPPR